MGGDITHSERAGMVRLGETLVPAAVTLHQAGDGPDAPKIEAKFEIRDGRPECVLLAVTANPDGRGVRLRDLELFTLDAVIESAFAKHAIHPDEWRDDDPRGSIVEATLGGRDDAERWAMRRDVVEARQSRRKPVQRVELERVAKVYREHVGQRNPTQIVATVLGYSERTAARRIQQARQAGLLPPTTPGKRKA
jgi:hypothetical protein